MEDLYDPEELILCPYNSAHRIRRCKMSFHLVKCKVNYPDQKRLPCDFNSTHMIPEPELQYHHQVCCDRKKVEARLVESVRGKSESRFPIPNYHVESEENWDNINTPTYDPQKYTETHEVIRHLDVASSAKKRNFRFEERQRLSQLSSQNAKGGQQNNDPHKSRQERYAMPRLNPEHPEPPVNQGATTRNQVREKLQKDKNKVFLKFDER